MQLLADPSGVVENVIEGEVTPEHPRITARRKVKRKIAEVGILWARVREMKAAVAKCEAEIDAAEAEHATTTAPLQAELDEIRKIQVDEIVDASLPNATVESRRVELVALVDAANAKLAAASRTGEDRIKAIQQEIDPLVSKLSGAEFNVTLLERDLRDALTTEERRLELYVANNTLQWAAQRCKSASAAVETAESILRGAKHRREHPEKIEALERRVKRMQAESAGAAAQLSAAHMAAEELMATVLAE